MQSSQIQKSIQQYQSFFQQVSQNVSKFKNSKISLQLLEKHQISMIEKNQNIQSKFLSKFGDAYFGIQGIKYDGLTVFYQVILGDFLLSIKVLNINESVGNSQQNICGQGNFGEIIKVQLGKRKIAIKRLKFIKLKSRGELKINSCDYAFQYNIKKAIQEYCIYKICSVIGIGPEVLCENNYDLVCYNDCIQFVMELCEKHNDNLQFAARQTVIRDLKFNVHLLHQYGFVHRDLKPDNILYSHTKRKFVLADFGLTHTVAQSVGQKSQATFSGTYSYLSEDMKKIYEIQSKKGLVDLFMNDLQGLKKTIIQFQQLQNISKQDFSANSMSFEGSQEQEQEFIQEYDGDDNFINSFNPIENPQGNPQQNFLIKDSQQQSIQQSKQFCLNDTSQIIWNNSSIISQLLPQSKCQVNHYINQFLYQFLFVNLEISDDPLAQMISDYCQREVINDRIKQYLKNQILKIFFIVKEKPLSTQAQISQYINIKKRIQIEKKKQKLQFLIRHYTASAQIVIIFKQLKQASVNVSESQYFEKCVSYFESKLSEKKDLPNKALKTTVYLQNFKQYYIQFQMTMMKQKNKKINAIEQSQEKMNNFSLEYLLLLNYGVVKYTDLKSVYSNILTQKDLTQRHNVKEKLLQKAKIIFSDNLQKLKNHPEQEVDIRFFQVLQIFSIFFEIQQLFSCLLQIEQLIENNWQKLHNQSKILSLKVLIRYKSIIKKKITQTSPFMVSWVKYEMPSSLVISKQNILCLLQKFENLYQYMNSKQNSDPIPYFNYTFVYKNVVFFLIYDEDFELAQKYLNKLQDIMSKLFSPNRSGVEKIQKLVIQFQLLAKQQKWQQAKQKILELESDFIKAPQQYFNWRTQYSCDTSIAYVYSKLGNFNEAVNKLKQSFRYLIIHQPFVYEKMIYVVDNLIMELLKAGKMSQIQIYAKISIKIKFNLFKQRLRNSTITTKQRVWPICLRSCSKILNCQDLLKIIQLYVWLMKPHLQLFKLEYMKFCKEAARQCYARKNYTQFMKFICLYLEQVPIMQATIQDFNLMEAYVICLIQRKFYNRAIKELKKFIAYIPFSNQFKLKQECYYKLQWLSKHLCLNKSEIYQFIHQQKYYLYKDQDQQNMVAHFKKKFKKHKKSHLKLKIVQKILKRLCFFKV